MAPSGRYTVSIDSKGHYMIHDPRGVYLMTFKKREQAFAYARACNEKREEGTL